MILGKITKPLWRVKHIYSTLQIFSKQWWSEMWCNFIKTHTHKAKIQIQLWCPNQHTIQSPTKMMPEITTEASTIFMPTNTNYMINRKCLKICLFSRHIKLFIAAYYTKMYWLKTAMNMYYLTEFLWVSNTGGAQLGELDSRFLLGLQARC